MVEQVQYIPGRKCFIKDNRPESTVLFLYDDFISSGGLFDVSLIPQYEIHVLYKDPVVLDEFSELLIDNTNSRIGALIPLQTVESVSQTLDVSWQRWYAFVASYYYCLNKEDLDRDTNKDKIVFAIIENSRYPADMSREELLIGLQYYGAYSKKLRISSLTELLPKKIIINRISPFLIKLTYIKDVLCELIYEENPVLLFMYLYQVMEILMDDVLVKGFIDNVLSTFDGNLSLRAEKGETTELTRINKVLLDCGINDRPEFMAQCKILLKMIKKNSENTFSDSLYQVRNSLVHRGRLFVGNNLLLHELAIVNDYFELLIYDIVSNYRKRAGMDIGLLYAQIASCKV